MSLLEFLRQWQRGRLTAGVAISVVLHLGLVAFVLWGQHLLPARYDVKRGETLIVELPKADDSPPPGRGATPAPTPPPAMTPPPAPPATPAPQAPKVAAVPTPPAAKPVAKPPAPRPVEPAPRETERRVASPSPPPPKEAEPTPTPAPAVTPPKPADVAPQPERPAQEPPPHPGERQVASLPPAAPPAPSAPDIRTALRRGQGGAGGSGEGRAGIEGEPIPLDSKDPKYSDYLDQVRRRIKEKWGFPCVKNEATRQCDYKTTTLVIEFGIAKDGKVPFVNVLRSSGYPIYDDYAVNAVKLASPFPPIPDSFSKKGVPINATFSYVVESSLANILR